MQAKFMTGIHGGFDRVRVARETRPGFHGLEVSCLRDPGEAKEVADYASAKGLATGVHFPLVSGTYPAVGLHPWLTSRDEHVRNAGFEAISRDRVSCSTGRQWTREPQVPLSRPIYALGFTSLMLPYITNVHLWTAKLGTNRFGGHHPLHPNLKEADGWGNMRGLLQILASLGNAYVMFEHRADLITDGQLDETYSWVATELSATCGIR